MNSDASVRRLSATVERFPIAGRFAISRGSRTEAVVVTATVSSGSRAGRGECVPYARYGETVASVVAEIEGIANYISDGLTREELQVAMAPGAMLLTVIPRGPSSTARSRQSILRAPLLAQ